jgi:hypothetical protein
MDSFSVMVITCLPCDARGAPDDNPVFSAVLMPLQ